MMHREGKTNSGSVSKVKQKKTKKRFRDDKKLLTMQTSLAKEKLVKITSKKRASRKVRILLGEIRTQLTK